MKQQTLTDFNRKQIKKCTNSYVKLLAIVILLLSGFNATICAQSSVTARPQLFAAFPDTLTCNEDQLNQVFAATAQQPFTFSCSNNFLFTGTVTAKMVKYSNLESLVLKSSVLNNTIFHISKRTNDDNSITYVGQMINQNYADGYELKKSNAGNYQLIKIKTAYIIQD